MMSRPGQQGLEHAGAEVGLAALRRAALAAVMGGLVMVTAGCMSTATSVLDIDHGAEGVVWPPAPAAPRIAYVGSVSRPSDLGVRLSMWRRFVNAATGDVRGNEAFVKPLGLYVDDADNLCIADVGARCVGFFNCRDRTYRRWDTIGGTGLISPVAFVKSGDVFFVADSELGKVLAFDSRGKLLYELDDELERPVGLAVSGAVLFVADAEAHRIVSYAIDGRFTAAFGVRGDGPGMLNYPTHLATDTAGHIYVTDSVNARVQVFDTDGRSVSQVGSRGDGSGRFSRPKGIALDADEHLYVADAVFDNVQVFDADGRFLMHWGETGDGIGEFWIPAGLAIDSENRIFVADSYNRRIQVFNYMGTP